MVQFGTTSWSMVLAAGGSQTVESRRALEELCSIYWRPLYAYIRQRGFSVEDAQDLTQEIFTRILAKDYLKGVGPAKGKFRSFLLASVNHFLSNELDRAHALKRGGAVTFLALDFEDAEHRYARQAVHPQTADKLFDRAWALALMESALTKLERECEHAGKNALFQRFRGTLSGAEEQLSYREIGQELELTEGAVKVAIHRLRRRYRDLLVLEVKQTLPEPRDINEELRHLLAAVQA